MTAHSSTALLQPAGDWVASSTMSGCGVSTHATMSTVIILTHAPAAASRGVTVIVTLGTKDFWPIPPSMSKV